MFKNVSNLAKGILSPKSIVQNRFTSYPQIETNTIEMVRLAPNLYLDYDSGANEGQNSIQSRPLVVMMSWLNAKDKYLNKYNDFYMRRGFDVLTAKVAAYDMFYPDHTGKLCLDALEHELAHYESIIIHSFSFGIYVLGTMLLELEKRKEKGTKHMVQSGLALKNRIKAVALDSVVTADLTLGLSGNFNHLPRSYKLYLKSLQMFLKIHKNTTNYLLDTNEFIFNHPLRAPALVMVSDDDLFGNVVLSEKIVNIWRNKDIDVKYKRWKNGHHVQLMKFNPFEYGQLIDELINKTQISNRIIRP